MRSDSSEVSFSARLFRRVARFVLPALVALWAPGAFALPVTIEPNGYAGQWSLANTWYSGTQVLDLAPGAYQLSIGGADGTGFTVAEDGTVTVTNPVATEGGAAWLRFHTAPVTLDPAAYQGYWSLSRVTGNLLGAQTLQLVPGLAYLARVGGFGSVRFSLEADGTVSTQALASAMASGSTLTLRTTPVNIDPWDYAGYWHLDASTPESLQGPHSLALVPGLRYRLGVGGWGGLLFSVGADGTVSTQATASAMVSGSTLTLRTVAVVINTRDYAGFWSIAAATRQTWQHTQTLRLVPAILYRLLIGSRGGFSFTVEADGTVSTQATASAAVWRNTLVLNTVPVRIAPRDPARAWTVSAAVAPVPNDWSGTHTLKLVPGLLYQLRQQGPSAYDFFTLSETCVPSPTSLVVGGTGFDLSCNP
ncbi:hypothetical protein [Archangium sp.]|uniref:hypothetical protein n=1 Tax=Archangium sp. TaxID=1872627 RepID=UPI002D65F556|nr:hypothetical protein [Archangium sp.]HYO58561.1 hypothetical protein [Archangium sp.]